MTGESWPVEKGPGQDVFAGTINGNGALDVAVRRVAADSTIARIIHLVEHAQKQPRAGQTFVDRFARRYTPAVVVLAAIVAFGGPLVTAGVGGYAAAFGTWSYRALALLVVACPCARDFNAGRDCVRAHRRSTIRRADQRWRASRTPGLR